MLHSPLGVANGQRAGQMPAVKAVAGAPQPDLVFIRRAACNGVHPFGGNELKLIRVDGVAPIEARRQTRVFEPAAVVMSGNPVLVSRPDNLRHGILQPAEQCLAFLQLLLRALLLSDVQIDAVHLSNFSVRVKSRDRAARDPAHAGVRPNHPELEVKRPLLAFNRLEFGSDARQVFGMLALAKPLCRLAQVFLRLTIHFPDRTMGHHSVGGYVPTVVA